jgi:hypothetical protein
MSESKDDMANLRARWSALPETHDERATSPTPPVAAVGGATPAAVRPLSTETRAEPVATKKAAPRTQSTSTVVTPLAIGASASLALGVVLAVLQTAVWMTPIFEIVTGVVIGCALIPLRRHPDGSEALLMKALVGCVALTFLVYILASCIAHAISPVAFIAATTIGTRASLSVRSGLGFPLGAAVTLASAGLAFAAARATSHLAKDETLDRW